jgi:hypothetical protein
MARQNTRLVDIQYVPSSVGSIYANAAAGKSFIAGFVLFNNHTSSVTVSLHNVPDSGGSLGTAGNGNKFHEITLATKETSILEFDYPVVLIDTNDSIQASATVASQVTIQVLGDRDQ